MKKFLLPLFALVIVCASLPLILFAGDQGFVLAAVSPNKQKISCIRSHEPTLLAALKNNGFKPKQDDTGFIYSLIGHDGPVSSDPSAQQNFWGLWQADSIDAPLRFADFGPASIVPQDNHTYVFSFGSGSTPQLPAAARTICNNQPVEQDQTPPPSPATSQSGSSLTQPGSESFAYLLNNYSQASKAEQDWAAMALGAHGRSAKISDTSSSAITSTARVALAKIAQGHPAVRELSTLKTSFDGKQFGDKNLVNDDIFALLAIAGADRTWLNDHPQPLSFIAASQRANGSFGYAPTGDGDVDMTAAALWALRFSSNYAKEKTAARNYLLSAQNSDGGFGYQPGQSSNVPSSAWVLLGLRAINSDTGQVSAYLRNTRQSDGSWRFGQSKSYLATSYAVLALSGELLPVIANSSAPAKNVGLAADSPAAKPAPAKPGLSEAVATLPAKIIVHGCAAAASASASASTGNGQASATASASAQVWCW